MKKLLGVLALALSVSGIASAKQDVVKDINFNQDFRASFSKPGDAKKYAGIKKDNITKGKSRTEIGTTLGLNDEWGLDANLYYKREDWAGYSNGKKDKTNLGGSDLVDANIAKNIKLGSLDTNTKLGVRHWTNRAGSRRTHSTGESNEFYFGPTFSMNLFGQNIKTTLEGVYFTQNGNGDQDGRYYHTAAKYDDNGNKIGDYAANHGWGANLLLGTEGKIVEGGFGKVSYDVELDHYLRDAKGSDNKSNVKLDYTVGLTYDTPTFGGFYGFIRPENNWTKHTAVDGYENEFSLWTGVGYKTGFDTSVGRVTINPSVRYRPVHNDTERTKDSKKTTQNNELRAGVKVGLTVKN